MAKEVQIAGAGLAGLVAGITLARQGFRVKISEARPNIGGNLRYADSTLMNPAQIEKHLGVRVDEALEPWTYTRIWAYGKKYELPNPKGVQSFTVERGGRETSLENVLYRQALKEGVEIALGQKLSKQDLKELPPGSIIATGLDREAFEAIDIPCRPFFCHMTTGTGNPSRPGVIVYFDRFTREFGYYFQANGSAGSLVFSVQRPLVDGEKQEFRRRLYENDGIDFSGWNDNIAVWAAWPLAVWRNLRLMQDDKILAGTLAGVVSPILLFGVNGALLSGKIAAMAVTDRDQALKEFKRIAPLYYPQFAFRKLREYAPHGLLKPLIQSILSSYHPSLFPWLMMFALWPPGYHRQI